MEFDPNPVAVLQACIKRAIPFVAYRLPNSTDIRLLVAKQVDSFLFIGQEVFEQAAYLVVPFDNQQRESYLLYARFENNLNTLSTAQIAWIYEQPEQALHLPENKNNTDKEDYQLAFERILRLIRCEKIIKAIVSRCHFVPQISASDAPSHFLHLCDMQASTYNYLLYIPNTGLWLGASPELFLRKGEHAIETVSLAGTMKYAERIDWKEKDLNEQDIVSNYILEHLNEFKVKGIEKKGPQTVSAGQVSHLKTIFRFPKDGVHGQLGRFVNALHPTPAVCGYPKDLSKQYILETEMHERGLYAGFLGSIQPDGQFAFYVNIRCMQYFANGSGLYVGGGITALSELEAEYNETVLKAENLLRILVK